MKKVRERMCPPFSLLFPGMGKRGETPGRERKRVLPGKGSWVFFSLLFLLASGGFFRYVMPLLEKDPMESLAAQLPVAVYRESNGKLLYLERRHDGAWRFDIPLSQVPPHFIRALLATEDFHFFRHAGVDWQAFFRALGQNLIHRKKISGASTLTMQLAGMSLPGRHTLFWKCRQMWGAWKLEQRYSKEKILIEYINRLPFGGKWQGLECAALYYFGIPAKDLTPSQSMLLCGLPQRPNFFRPDRHRLRAVKRMQKALAMMEKRGLITEEERQMWASGKDLHFRDFQVPATFLNYRSPGIFRHAIQAAKAESGRKDDSLLSIRQELTKEIGKLLADHLSTLRHVSSCAALLVENSSGRILSYIGNGNLSASDGGWIDIIPKRREAGSTLKPFFYAEAIEGGLLTAETLLLDAPLRFGDYAPGNFDKRLYGKLPAKEALSRSLNTPVIQLTAHLGVKRMERLLVRAGIDSFRPHGKETPGVTLALGCGGCTLLELTNAYRMLAGQGGLRPLTIFHEPLPPNPKEERQVFAPGTCAMISSMLRTPLGHDAPDCAWKTGTSSNFRDAWAILYTPTHTLGVWFGNPSGKSSPALVGSSAALPAAREIMTLLRDRDGSFSDSWVEMEKLLEERELCRKTGLSPQTFCQERFSGKAVPGIPLVSCRACRETQNRLPPRILAPLPGEYFLHPEKKSLSLPLKIASPPGGRLLLFVNGKKHPQKDLTRLTFPEEGRYTLQIQQIFREKEELKILTSSEVTLLVKPHPPEEK